MPAAPWLVVVSILAALVEGVEEGWKWRILKFVSLKLWLKIGRWMQCESEVLNLFAVYIALACMLSCEHIACVTILRDARAELWF